MAKRQSFDAQTLVKHHYWIVAGLGGLALPICWYLATGNLAEVFDSGKKARDSVRQQVDSFQAAQQPNEEIKSELSARQKALNLEVYKAWKFQYERQQDCMGWNLRAVPKMWAPPLLDGTDLEGKEVHGAWTADQQAKLENARTKGVELDPRLRSVYGGWLSDKECRLDDDEDEKPLQFRRLYALISLRKPMVMRAADEEGEKQKKPAAFGNKQQDEGDRVATTQYQGLLPWREIERMYLEQKFGKGDAWRRAPTTAQVVYTQESMNVYAIILHYIVARTNGAETEHQFLPIKLIETIRLGEDCQSPVKGGGPGAGGPGIGALGPGGAPSAGTTPQAGTLGSGGANTTQDPYAPFAVGSLGTGGGGAGRPGDAIGGAGGVGGNQGPSPPDGVNRYVDYDGYAVPDPNPKQQPSAEYRMLPVIMRFVMDQRKLPEVLAWCVESPLPIEVKQWNMREPGLAEDMGSGGPGGAGPGGANFGPGATSGPGSQTVPGGGFGAADGGRKEAPTRRDLFGGEVELGPYDREIEIKGVIYIYNPPDPTKVGTGAETGDAAAVPGPLPQAKQPVGPENGPAVVEPSPKVPEPKTQDAKTLPEAKTAPANGAKTPAEPAKTGNENGAAKAAEKAPEPAKVPMPKAEAVPAAAPTTKTKTS